MHLTRSRIYQKTSAHTPLTANPVGEQSPAGDQAAVGASKDEAQSYSIDEWIMLIKSYKSQTYLAAGNALPQQGILALNSVVKGCWKPKGNAKDEGGKETKGKGDGKGKGKDGKGKGEILDHIQSHGCGKWGYFVRDCPDRAIKAMDNRDGGQTYNRVSVAMGTQMV